jgi:hypothetical protein
MCTIAKEITLGVSTVGNIQALRLCLAAALNAPTLPSHIQVRFEGELPNFGDFYFEQIADIARLKNVSFTFTRANSQGVRYARDWQMDQCPTDLLWCLDDDVIPDYTCLEGFRNTLHALKNKQWGFLAGIKVDVNNRRQYPDFDHKERKNWDEWDQNHFAPKSYHPVPLETLDAGNVLLNLPLLREKKIRFSIFTGSENAGGEDTLFAHQCLNQNLLGYLCTAAQSLHLEKEQVVFTDRVARAESVRLGKEILNANISSNSKLQAQPERSSNSLTVGVDLASGRDSTVEQ